MSVWRAAYIALLIGAICIGRPRPAFAAVLIFDLIGTIAFAANPHLLSFVDMAAFLLLIGGNVAEKTVGTLFGIMAIAEVFAYRLQVYGGYLAFVNDPLSWVQCVVIGGANGGLGRLRNAIHRFADLRRSGGAGVGWSSPAHDLAGNRVRSQLPGR